MPRTARKKSEESMYHIMSRSISEIELFRCNEDKDWYLSLLGRYIEKYRCKIYAYCLMDNHVHLFINPCGYDISTFMLSLNTAYVTYYNKRYNRHGHLFQGRFTSIIVDNTRYSLTLSAYIHSNPKDLPEYEGKEEQYQYSSYGVYTGYRKDSKKIVDTEYILKMISYKKDTVRQKYRLFVESLKGSVIMEEINDNSLLAFTENEYKSEKCTTVRYKKYEELISKIIVLFGKKTPEILITKYSRQTSKIRAFTTYVLRVLCGLTYKQICKFIGNMSLSGISRLSNEGYRLLCKHVQYRKALNCLIS